MRLEGGREEAAYERTTWSVSGVMLVPNWKDSD